MILLPCCGAAVPDLGLDVPNSIGICSKCGTLLSLEGGEPKLDPQMDPRALAYAKTVAERIKGHGKTRVVRAMAMLGSIAEPVRIPCCGAIIRSHISPEMREPVVGDVTVCSECGTILRYSVADPSQGRLEMEICDPSVLPDYLREQVLEFQNSVKAKLQRPTS